MILGYPEDEAFLLRVCALPLLTGFKVNYAELLLLVFFIGVLALLSTVQS